MIKKNGFTLIELLIVIAIIGILAGIAYPSYLDSVSKSRRADAKGALLGFANAMERHFTTRNTYCGAATDNDGTCLAATGVPIVFAYQSPPENNPDPALNTVIPFYSLTVSAADAISYTLLATREGAQANDRCGNLTLTNVGVKDIDSAHTGITAVDCW